MIYMTISPGTRIKELRQLAGLSQEELGRRVGVQRAAINKYEKGAVTNIPTTVITIFSHTASQVIQATPFISIFHFYII